MSAESLRVHPLMIKFTSEAESIISVLFVLSAILVAVVRNYVA